MDNLINEQITVSSKEEKTTAKGAVVIKIKDEKGLVYSVYKLKKDGTETVAWGQLKDISVGQKTGVSFREENVNDPKYGQTTYRTVMSFNTDIGNGLSVQPKPRSVAPIASQAPFSSKTNDDEFWQKKALQKCLWQYFIEVKKGEELTRQDELKVYETFKQIENASERFFSPLAKEVEKTAPAFFKAPVPVEPEQEDVPPPTSEYDSVEDIPF